MLSILSLTGTSIDGQDERSLHLPNGEELQLQDREEDSHEGDHIGLSKAEIRKSNKPIMEKRRRARINTCLNELKSLILDALKKDPSRHSKLEKADILEMTVKHLQAVQRQQLAIAVANDPSVLDKFKGGFTECAQEITRYISRIDGVDGGIRQRLQRHLTNCTSGLNSTTPLTFTAMAGLPMNFGNKPQVLPHTPSQGDLSNNNSRLIHRLVAARLAAAGDTAGAALLLQGGLSLLARSGAAPPQRHIPPQVFHPQRPPNNLPKISLPVINEGASSSRETLNRVSAFTAVKRPGSPPRIIDNPLKQNSGSLPNLPKLVTPTAIRPFPCADQRKTLVQAQVSLQPVRNSLGDEAPSPLDFSFRSGIKRQTEDQIASPRPLKILKVEEMIPATSTTTEAPKPKQSDLVKENSSNVGSPTEKEEGKVLPENPEGDEKDMWRPW